MLRGEHYGCLAWLAHLKPVAFNVILAVQVAIFPHYNLNAPIARRDRVFAVPDNLGAIGIEDSKIGWWKVDTLGDDHSCN